MPRFYRMDVYVEAKALTLQVYRCAAGFPTHERFGLTSQLTRAAVSVGANLVEGQRRAATKDFRNFVCIAEGSLAETQYLLEVSRDLGYLSEADFTAVWEQSITVERMLQGLSLGLDRKMREG